MKIQTSSIIMASSHRESSYAYKESMTMEAAKSKNVAGAILTLSQETDGKSVKDAMVDYQKQEKEAAKQRQKENEAKSWQDLADEMRARRAEEGNFEIPDDLDMQIKMLRQILAALRGEKLPPDINTNQDKQNKVLDLRSAQYRKLEASSINLKLENSKSLGTVSLNPQGTLSTGTTWQKITAVSGFMTESESTTFASKGIVTTADGRSIDFNVEVSMSRAFTQKFDMLDVVEYIKTDPLMINLDTNIGSVRDQKFFFDLDSDGEEEEISFAGKGSGFLALDKNGDGKINDGSELFGTTSGDGFKDLAAYDEDGNGWIDENDDIFSKLKVWTKDENGNDYLIDLKKADVGAIYLGNADTQFSLKDDENKLNAEIKKTGIYLKESTGAVGTLNHVDLVI